MANELQVLLKMRDEMSASLAKVSSNMDKTGAHIQAVGKLAAVGLAAGGAAAVAFGGMALKAAGDFDQAMANVKAVSGATGEEFAKLDKLAMKLGKDTVFSAKQAASGIEEMVKGGISITDILDGAAKSMLDLASAGGVTLPESAEIAANAMAMFGLKGQDMAHVADLIAGAANASSLTVSDFRFSLQMAGAVARTAGQSFDETATAIAILGKEGLKGSDAGTSLKQMMLNLNPVTKQQIQAFRDLGLITADGTNKFIDQAGKIKGLTEVAGILKSSVSGLTESERLMKLELAFGTDAVRVAAIMARQGGEGFTEMAKGMAKVTAESVAATKLDTLKGSMEQLSGSWETLLITIGKPMLPVIRGIVDGLTGFTNTLIENVAPFLAKFEEPWNRFTRLFEELSVGNLEGFALDSSALLKDIGQALADFVLPFIGDLAVNLGTWALKAIETLGAWLPDILTQLGKWGDAFVDWLKPTLPRVTIELDEYYEAIKKWVNDTGPLLTEETAKQLTPALVNWVPKATLAIGPEFVQFAWTLNKIIWNMPGEIIKSLLNLAWSIPKGIAEGLKTANWDEVAANLKALLTKALEALDFWVGPFIHITGTGGVTFAWPEVKPPWGNVTLPEVQWPSPPPTPPEYSSRPGAGGETEGAGTYGLRGMFPNPATYGFESNLGWFREGFGGGMFNEEMKAAIADYTRAISVEGVTTEAVIAAKQELARVMERVKSEYNWWSEELAKQRIAAGKPAPVAAEVAPWTQTTEYLREVARANIARHGQGLNQVSGFTQQLPGDTARVMNFNFGADSVRSEDDIYRIADEVSRRQGSAVRVGA